MNQELPALMAEARAIAADADRTFGHLSHEQLNWKPAADRWSVAQCFEHLIKINSTYFRSSVASSRGHTPVRGVIACRWSRASLDR